MSSNPKREHFIKAILSNEKLTEEEKSELISDMMDEFKNNYPQLQNHATKQDVSETELRLLKEIKELDVKSSKEREQIRKEIKEIELKASQERNQIRIDLTKEIKELDIKASKEREQIRVDLTKDIKELEVNLTSKIENIRNDTLKWTFVFWASQMIAIGTIIYKVFS